MQPYQSEVYDNRRIDRAYEYTQIRQWHGAWVSAGDANRWSSDRMLGYRREPDTGWPPPAHEHSVFPPQRQLDPLRYGLQPPARQNPDGGGPNPRPGATLPSHRLFAEPLPTVYQYDGPPPVPAAETPMIIPLASMGVQDLYLT